MGIIDVQPTDPVFADKQLTVPQEGTNIRRMRTNSEQRCIALVYGLCSIYEKRPQACRDFQVGNRICLNVRAGKLNSHQQGFNIGDLATAQTKLIKNNATVA